MSEWKKKAVELLPTYKELIYTSENPMSLWRDLYFEFTKEFDNKNMILIDKIIEYANYSIRSDDSDLSSAVIVFFLEDLPMETKFHSSFPSWFTYEDFVGLKNIFTYMVDLEVYKEIEKFYKDSLST